jgi:hypothetical protein
LPGSGGRIRHQTKSLTRRWRQSYNTMSRCNVRGEGLPQFEGESRMGGVNFILVTVAFSLIYLVRKQLLETTEAMQREIDGLKSQGSGPS